jgi:hypothetical protein
VAEEDGDPDAHLHRPLDGLDVVHLHHRVELHALLPEEPVERLAGGGLAVEGDARGVGQGGEGDLRLAGQRVARGADHRELVVPEGNDVHPRPRLGVGHHADLRRAEDDVIVDLIAAAVDEPHVHLGVRFEQPLLDALQLVQAYRVDGGDGAGAGDLRRLLADLLLHLAEAGENFLAAAEEPLPAGVGVTCRRAA